MTTAFRYRARKGTSELTTVRKGETVQFFEGVEYVIVPDGGWVPALRSRIAEMGGDVLDDGLAVLTFGNFVGLTSLAGAAIDVVSSKIGENGVSAILAEVSELAAALLFSSTKSPTAFRAGLTALHRAPVPYHQLQVLRHAMLEEKPGERLQDWLNGIQRNPTRRFQKERPLTPISKVKRLDARAIRTVFSRVDRMSSVHSGSELASSPLAKALTFGAPPQPHFPHVVAAPRGRLSFDTPENRFVRHVVEECLAIVHRFVDHPRLHATLKRDCRLMLGILLERSEAAFLEEAGSLSSIGAPTQALTKSEGYRDVLGFWNKLIRHVSLPDTDDETTRLLEGRDMARLYEYWVFMKVLQAVTNVLGAVPETVTIVRDEFGDTLVAGLPARFGNSVSVAYNPTFKRSGTAGSRAYSTPLRPDVVLSVGNLKYGFDAKYKLAAIDQDENEDDDGAWTYKRADLYKMHTYRDAIQGMRSAFVVYPGSEFIFFGRSSGRHVTVPAEAALDGVGAVPLRPAAPSHDAALVSVVRSILTPRAP